MAPNSECQSLQVFSVRPWIRMLSVIAPFLLADSSSMARVQTDSLFGFAFAAAPVVVYFVDFASATHSAIAPSNSASLIVASACGSLGEKLVLEMRCARSVSAALGLNCGTICPEPCTVAKESPCSKSTISPPSCGPASTAEREGPNSRSF